MDSDYLIHAFINALLITLLFIFSCLFLPPFFLIKSIVSIFRCFSPEKLEGKVVVITGASSGIGEQLVYEYAKKGASLVIMARRESQLQKVADTAREMGSPDVLSVCGDVSNIDDCKRFIDEAVNHFGRLDHLVNNAGINRICAFEDANDVTKLTPVMDVNFWGAIYPTYFAIPHLKKNRGKIVVNATTGALLHPPKLSIYTASKAALICFYETMRVELGPAISITIVTPGFIQTGMTQGKRLPVDGVVKRNRGLFRNGFIGALPHMSSKSCAIAIVEATCRGARYVTEPKWYRPLYVLKHICPELFEWSYRAFFFKSRVSDPSKQQRD